MRGHLGPKPRHDSLLVMVHSVLVQRVLLVQEEASGAEVACRPHRHLRCLAVGQGCLPRPCRLSRLPPSQLWVWAAVCPRQERLGMCKAHTGALTLGVQVGYVQAAGQCAVLAAVFLLWPGW